MPPQNNQCCRTSKAQQHLRETLSSGTANLVRNSKGNHSTEQVLYYMPLLELIDHHPP